MGVLGGTLAMLNLFQLRFDTTVSLQSLLVITMWVVTVVIYLTKVRSDIGSLQTYVTTHQVEANQRDEQLQRLALISEHLTTMVDNIVDRIERIERTCERRHNGGPKKYEG